MSAIYDLQKALNSVLAQSDYILEELRRSRTKLHNEFEDYIELFEESWRYANDYVRLCKATHYSLEDRVAFARDLPILANHIRQQARDVCSRHESISKYFQDHKPRIFNGLSSGTVKICKSPSC